LIAFGNTVKNGGFLLLLLSGLLAVMGCNREGQEGVANVRLLARVGNKTLDITEMEGMFYDGISSQDSAAVIQAFVGRWVREAAILNEAERNIPPNLNINKLVRDYRASLVRSSYEKILVEKLLDSIITQAELEEFYDENKLLYELEKPIMRCFFIKVPIPTPEGSRLRNLWNMESKASVAGLKKYCDQYAEVALLDDNLWYAIEDVGKQLPVGTITTANVGSKRDFTQRDEHHQYYFRLFELKNRKEIAPLSYIQDQARKVILHKRKLQLVEEVKEDIYQRELRDNNVEILIK
jgi:hypothetical protein